MKTITTIEEIKAEAEKDSRASLYVTLNKPIVDWLLSINKKNRPVLYKNVLYWANAIRHGDWDVDSSVMKIDDGGTMLIDGQHRLTAINATQNYTLATELKIVPREKADAVFANQDCNGKRRSVVDIISLDGFASAKWKATLDKCWRLAIDADDSPSSASTVRRFIERFAWAEFLESQRKINGSSHKVPAAFYVAMLLLVEKDCTRKNAVMSMFEQFVAGTFSDTTSPLLLFRNMITEQTGKTPKSPKALFWLSLKSMLLEMKGEHRGKLRVGDADIREMSTAFDIASPTNFNDDGRGITAAIKKTKAAK